MKKISFLFSVILTLFLNLRISGQVYNQDWQTDQTVIDLDKFVIDDQQHIYHMGDPSQNSNDLIIQHYDNQGSPLIRLEAEDYDGYELVLDNLNYVYVTANNNITQQQHLIKFHKNRKHPVWSKQITNLGENLHYLDGNLYSTKTVTNGSIIDLIVSKISLDGDVVSSFSESGLSNARSTLTSNANGELFVAFTIPNGSNTKIKVQMLNPSTMNSSSSQTVSSTSNFSLQVSEMIADANDVYVTARTAQSGSNGDFSTVLVNVPINQGSLAAGQSLSYRRTSSFSTWPGTLNLDNSYAYVGTISRDAGATPLQEYYEVMKVTRAGFTQSTTDLISGSSALHSPDDMFFSCLAQSSYYFHYASINNPSGDDVRLQEMTTAFGNRVDHSINFTGTTNQFATDMKSSGCYVYVSAIADNNSPYTKRTTLTRFSDPSCVGTPTCMVDANLIVNQDGLNVEVIPDHAFNEFTFLNNYSLDMGDGTIYTKANFVDGTINHSYSQPGDYTICLTVVGEIDGGSTCSDTECKTISIKCYDEGDCNKRFHIEFPGTEYTIQPSDKHAYTSNSDLLIVGTQNHTTGKGAFVASFSEDGYLNWSFSFNDLNISGDIQANCILEGSDGNIYVSGTSNIVNSVISSNRAVFLLRLTADGAFIGMNSYSHTGNMVNTSLLEFHVSQTPYLLLAAHSNSELHFLKLNLDGTINSQAHYVPNSPGNYDIVDLGIILDGSTSPELFVLGNTHTIPTDEHPYMINLDKDLTIHRFKEFTNNESQTTVAIESTIYDQYPAMRATRLHSDGTFILTVIGQKDLLAVSSSPAVDYKNGMSFFVSANLDIGNDEYVTYSAGNSSGYHRLELNALGEVNGKFFLGGRGSSFGNPIEQPITLMVNPLLLSQVYETRQYKPSVSATQSCMTNLSQLNSGYVLHSGFANNGNQDLSTFWVLKTNSTGMAGNDCDLNAFHAYSETKPLQTADIFTTNSSSALLDVFNGQRVMQCDIIPVFLCQPAPCTNGSGGPDPCVNYNPTIEFELVASCDGLTAIRILQPTQKPAITTIRILDNGIPKDFDIEAWDSDQLIFPLTPQDYTSGEHVITIQFINEDGCVKTSMPIEFDPSTYEMKARITGDLIFCEGENVVLNGNTSDPHDRHKWEIWDASNGWANRVKLHEIGEFTTPGFPSEATAPATLSDHFQFEAGKCYTIILVTKKFCDGVLINATPDIKLVCINPSPGPYAPINYIIPCDDDCITVGETPIESGQTLTAIWSDGHVGFTREVCTGTSVSYTVTFTNQFGCTATQDVTVEKDDCCLDPCFELPIEMCKDELELIPDLSCGDNNVSSYRWVLHELDPPNPWTVIQASQYFNGPITAPDFRTLFDLWVPEVGKTYAITLDVFLDCGNGVIKTQTIQRDITIKADEEKYHSHTQKPWNPNNGISAEDPCDGDPLYIFDPETEVKDYPPFSTYTRGDNESRTLHIQYPCCLLIWKLEPPIESLVYPGDVIDEREFGIAPNPATNNFTVSLNFVSNKKSVESGTLRVYSSVGTLVYEAQKVPAVSSRNIFLANEAEGIYFVTYELDGALYKRVLILRP